MKRKDIQDLKNKTTDELGKLAADILLQITKLQMELKMHKLKNTNAVSNLRKDLARILTAKRANEKN